MRNSTVLQEIEILLSEKLNTSLKIHSSELIGGGCINHASKIKTSAGDFFVKWNADCESDIFLREAESLTELKKAAAGSLVIPEVFAVKEVNNTPGFLVLEYLLTSFSNTNSNEELGRGLAMVHKYGNEKFGFSQNNYCGATLQNNSHTSGWIEFFRDKRLLFLIKLVQDRRPFSSAELNVFDRLLDRIPKLIPDFSTPVLIHGDLWSGNYLITEKGPALIDPASYYADREMEFAIITMFGGFSSTFFSAYNEINPLPSDWKERNDLYQLYHILNHYYLFGGGYKSQAIQIARKYI